MQENIFRSAVKSGLILGVLFIARFLITTLGSGAIVSILSWLLVAGIVVAMWKLSEQYRDNENEGFISFGKSFGFVILSFLYASIVAMVVRIVYYVTNPDFFADAVNDALLVLDQSGMATAEAEQMLEVIMSPVFYSFLVIFGNMFLGVITGLIIAAVVKKEKSIF